MLEKRHVHLQRVLALVGGVELAHHGQRAQPADRLGVERDGATRHGPGRGCIDGEAAERQVVRRSDQHHAADAATRRGEAGIGAGGDRAGIDVAGVRADDRLGQRRERRIVGGLGQEQRELPFQRVRFGWIEGPGDGGMADRGHRRQIIVHGQDD